MTKSQQIALRMSEVRSRLSEISALEGEAFTPEIKVESDRLTTEFQGLESRSRAAIVAEGAEEARAAGQFGNGDGEPAEIRSLLGRVSLADYLTPATAGLGLTGAPVELAAALKVSAVGPGGGVAVPWAILEQRDAAGLPVETRAFTTTTQNDGPEAQRPILQRLFGPGVLDALGVRMDSVPEGKSEWPLFSTGVAPAQAKEGTAAVAAVAATFAYANLKPKRLTGRYEYSHEMAASVPGIEQAFRRDLADAVKASMSQQIVNGAAPTNAAPQNVEGFITRIAADDDTAEATAARYGRLHADAVDGIHAGRETEVMSIIGDETYQHAAGVYIAGSGESGSELLARRSGGCMASTYIPAKTGMVQPSILHAAGPNGGGMMRGDSVAAMWPTLEVIRDIYTKASQGTVLTWVTLWDARTALRAAAYKVRGIHIG